MSDIVQEIVTTLVAEEVVTERVIEQVAVVTGPRGDAGPPGSDADATAAITAHTMSTRPHQAAESGRDFAGWYTAAAH